MKEEIKEFKREKILEAALQLFYERGFAGTTVASVAEQIGVTKPFIYTYFESKHDLLVAIYEQVTSRILNILDESLAIYDSPDQQLAEFVSRFAYENMESQMIATVFLQEEKHLGVKFLNRIHQQQKTFDRRLTDLIKKGVDAGLFKVEDPAVTSFAITGMVRWIQRWYQPEGRLSIDEISRLLSDLALQTVQYQPKAATTRPKIARTKKKI